LYVLVHPGFIALIAGSIRIPAGWPLRNVGLFIEQMISLAVRAPGLFLLALLGLAGCVGAIRLRDHVPSELRPLTTFSAVTILTVAATTTVFAGVCWVGIGNPRYLQPAYLLPILWRRSLGCWSMEPGRRSRLDAPDLCTPPILMRCAASTMWWPNDI
jgi:hypothetical protein